MTRRTLLTALVCAVVTGCGGGDDRSSDGTASQSGAEPSSDVASKYAPALNVDLRKMKRSDGGLYTQDLREGEGERARAGQTVAVHYTGWLPDGTKFDSSLDRGEPFNVVLGAGNVIAGWDQGLQGMRVGGRRLLVIPPSMAYGNQVIGDVIPAGSTLVFDVEMLEIR
jgi:FKBP-type peptidyl-prolyl cis-trans isomerase FkpA